MAIYFNMERPQEQPFAAAVAPAHEKIGAYFAQALAAIQAGEQERSQNIFKELGVCPEDTEAMSELMVALGEDGLQILTTEHTGVYFVSNGAQNIAVFKIGRKRASMEIMARFLARELGLERHIIPGMFCAILDPELDHEHETFEELWNGNHKIFTLPFVSLEDELLEITQGFGREKSAEETACAVVGIVQPFLTKQPKASLLDLTRMTMFALAIGLRDGKEDSFDGSTLLDVEDCMPVRIDPIWTHEHVKRSPSAIELSFLDKDPRSNKDLSLEEVDTLAALVQQWKISKIVQNLKRMKIRYEDSLAEAMPVRKAGTDEGGFAVEVQEPDHPHVINGRLSHLTSKNPKKRLLLPEQLDACHTRLQRIHDFILGCSIHRKTFTPQQLVHAVDLWGKIYTDAILQSPKLPSKLGAMVFSQGYNTVTGRRSPDELKFPIEFEKANQHQAAVLLRMSQEVVDEEPTPKPSPLED